MQRDWEPSTLVDIKECLPPDKREKCCSEEKCVTLKKGCVNLEGRRGNSLQPDLLEIPTQIILDSGNGNSLHSKKMAVPEAEKKSLRDQEKSRDVHEMLGITEDLEKDINNVLGPGSMEEILSSRINLQIT